MPSNLNVLIHILIHLTLTTSWNKHYLNEQTRGSWEVKLTHLRSHAYQMGQQSHKPGQSDSGVHASNCY